MQITEQATKRKNKQQKHSFIKSSAVLKIRERYGGEEERKHACRNWEAH